MTDRPILVAGAGIAGLTLALALSRQGLPVRVLERRSEHTEAGAGIQLGPNAMHVLARLGVAERVEPYAGAPEAIEVMDGASGRRIARFPLGEGMARRLGAPYRVAHRADLHAALLSAVRARGDIAIELGFEVNSWSESGQSVTVSSAEGSQAIGAALVGADGLWSAVCRMLHPGHPLTYSGKLAARTLVPANVAGERFARQVTGVWLGRDGHVVHYPVRAGREVAVVVVLNEPEQREGWGSSIEATSVLARLIRFSRELVDFLGRASTWHAWSLYDPPALPSWSRGRACLIGDAAHPILPFLAQGGGMAIEDAETLALLLAAERDRPAMAFPRFETLRRARVERVRDASRENGRVFHLAGPMALARNLTLAMVPGSLLMRRYDWLYRWNGDVLAG